MLKSILNEIKRMFRKTDEVFWHSEVQANKLVTHVIGLGIALLLTTWLLHVLDIFPMSSTLINMAVWVGIVELSIPYILSHYFKQETWWLKLVLLASLTLACASADVFLSYKVPLLMAIPVLLSSRYFSRSLTKTIAFLTVILFTLSTIGSVRAGVIDLNVVTLPQDTVITVISRFHGNSFRAIGLDEGMLMRNTLLYSYLPKLLTYILIAVISVNIAERGRAMVLEQAAITQKTSRIESELTLARDIQKGMIPDEFPAFPDRTEFDLYAIMKPAREVGGDYYDFALVDNSHLAFVMADVSGKSISASLFMAVAKTLMKSHAKRGLKPSEIFRAVNNTLCDGNKTGLFVTAWMGIIDLNTGKVIYANAGHCPPVIVRNGVPEVLSCKPCFILGGMENMEYPDFEIKLEKGDIIYLYTDGVTEAENVTNELYGTERLLNVIRGNYNCDMKEFCDNIEKDIHDFEKGNEQFDDLTMLALRYKGSEVQKITLPAVVDSIEKVTEFVNDRLQKSNIPQKIQTQIDVVIDELMSNVTKFAYRDGKNGDISVEMEVNEEEIAMTFRDSGVPFNPLEQADPDVNAPLEQRKIGGLGLFLVRKTMDKLNYVYENGQNVLTVIKKLGK
ncbi:MAG: SpoIIE family protein phosphatase [Erysipelotrichaceae bacterium]|nr:SpoIIE family protein phosphatase [Erysipelotrichaceae bacterium]